MLRLFDGAVLVHLLQPKGQKTFQDYAANIFCPYLQQQLQSVTRIDVIWDRYIPNSLKQGTRELRGQGIGSTRRRVLADTPIPVNWEGFLRLDANKEELFAFLAMCIQAMDTGEKIIISTCPENTKIFSSYCTDVCGNVSKMFVQTSA